MGAPPWEGSPDSSGHRALPSWSILPEAAIETLTANADRILEDCGVLFRDAPEARTALKRAGAAVRDERVHFPRGLAREIVAASAPRRFVQRAVNPARSVTFGAGRTVCAPALGAPFVRGRDGRRRHGRIEDVRTAAKLAQAAPGIDHAGALYCEPTDSPALVRHLDMLDAVTRHCDKPFMGYTRNSGQVADSLTFARLLFGDAVFESECCLLNLFNVRSPLTLSAATLEGLRLTAEADQGCVVASYAMMGMTGPATLAGTLALMLAEVTAAAAYVQIVGPGAPVIAGFYAAPFAMTTKMRPTFGGPESHLSVLAGAQLVRHLGLPFRGDGGLTAATVADAQALSESAFSLQAAMMARSDFALHAAGWLEDGLTFGFEKFARDAEVLAHLRREDALLRGGPSAEVAEMVEMAEIMEGEAPALALDTLLDAHEPPAMDGVTRARLDDFLRRRKRDAIAAAK